VQINTVEAELAYERKQERVQGHQDEADKLGV
jgi:hypothetical protein